MRRPSRAGLSLVLALCACIPLAAQNLASFGKEKPFSFTGGLSFNQIFYASSGIASRREPYSYVASGNLNLALYGWSVPLRFTFSNRQVTFSQPFNQYALHPAWKWITAHAGYTSLSFSPYTVNGHVFLGGAVEMEPEGSWKISALYGRFLKATGDNNGEASGHSPAFQRMGYGTKVTYSRGGNFADIIVFGAEDHEKSIAALPDSLRIFPEQNLVISVGGGATILQHLLLKAELATSAITRDSRAGKAQHDHLLAKTGLFEPRLSSAYHQAFKTSMDYQNNGWTAGIAYEKVDPGYRTLGAYYFNNDLESITVNTTASLLAGKMNVALSTGMQRDNLDKTKVSTLRRMVGSVNMNYAPSPKLNFSASWSSFQTFTNIRSSFEIINQLTPYDNLDTLNFTQVSRSASLTGMYTLTAAETKRQQLNLQFTAQEASEKQGENPIQAGTRFYNLNTGYSISLIPENMNVALAFNTAVNHGPSLLTRTMGPTTALTRSFFQRKFRMSLSASFNKTYSHGVIMNSVLNGRWSGNLTLRNKHNLNLSAVLSQRRNGAESISKSFTEFTFTAGYSFSFSSRVATNQ